MKAAALVVGSLFGILLAGGIAPAYSLLHYEYVSDFGRFGISYEGAFSHPQAIAQDDGGDIYVSDLGNKRIQKFDAEGAFLDQWGRSGTGASEFHEPVGIATYQDLVYVVDRDLSRVQVFELDGRYVDQWGQHGIGEGQFRFPASISVGVDGTVYVADSGNQRIQAFDPDGEFVSSFGSAGRGAAEFTHLAYVTTDSAGNVYGVDRGNSKIVKFDHAGNHLDTISFESNAWQFSPSALQVADDDSLFILNSADDRILHLEQDHSHLMVTERLGPFGNFMSYGADLLLSSSGHLYAVDSLGHRVFVYETPYVEQEPAMPAEPAAPEDSVPEPAAPEDTAPEGGYTIFACSQPRDSFNVIVGTESDDIIEGTDGDDLIFALGGSDIVSGYGGNDCIFGGAGDDIIFGNEGSDGIFGDQGNDILKGSSGDDIIYGNYGLDSIDGGEDQDVCIAADTDNQDTVSNCES